MGQSGGGTPPDNNNTHTHPVAAVPPFPPVILRVQKKLFIVRFFFLFIAIIIHPLRTFVVCVHTRTGFMDGSSYGRVSGVSDFDRIVKRFSVYAGTVHNPPTRPSASVTVSLLRGMYFSFCRNDFLNVGKSAPLLGLVENKKS